MSQQGQGFFSYDGPVIKALTMAGNMILVSLYFILTCLPVVTIVPSYAALYHTTVKIIRNSKNGVTRDYFATWKQELKQGILLNLLFLALFALFGYAAYFGHLNSQSSIGLFYLITGIIFCLFLLVVFLFLGPSLSRFEGTFSTQLRLALYFAMKKPWQTLLVFVVFAASALLVYFYLPLLIIMPGLYMTLVSKGIEQKLAAFQMENQQVQNSEANERDEEEKIKTTTNVEDGEMTEEIEAGEEESLSAFDLEEMMNAKGDIKKK